MSEKTKCGIFTGGEYSHACRLQASLVSLWFGHAQGKTTLSCFLILSRRFATRSARRMRTHVANATVSKLVHRLGPKKEGLPQGKSLIMIRRDFHRRRIFSCLPLTSELGLTVVRSRSRENNTQLFSNTLAPLRYALCAENANPRC